MKLSYFGHIMKRQGSLEQIIMLGKKEAARKEEGQMTWTNSIKEAIGISVQELSRATEHRTLQKSFIHKVARSYS